MLMWCIGVAVRHRTTYEATKELLASAKQVYGIVDNIDIEDYLTHTDSSGGSDPDLEDDSNVEEEDHSNDSENDEEGEDEDVTGSEDEKDDQSSHKKDSDDDLREDPCEELGYSTF